MVDARKIEQAIRRVKDQSSFIQELLIDALEWPIDEQTEQVEDISYEWSADELRTEGLDEKLVDGVVRQIVLPGNPWGIFILEFRNAEVFTADRGMTGTLRKILRGLVPSKRRDSSLASFNRENLLFICNQDYRHYRFAYFKAPQDAGKAAPLAAFGWGPGDPIRTLCEYNLNSLAWPDTELDEGGWVAVWAQAFDVEKVTKRFYEDYAAVFAEVETIIGREGALAGDELRMFTQLLFNRLMFLRFIERKGWLKFPGQQGSRYLATLATAAGIGNKSLYASRLQPLFFEGLAEEGKQNTDAYGTVPLLNGGLFERSDLDVKVADIPDEAFALIISQVGLFDRYNFTVEESTPLDIEVAIDPEMLGKVFEELVTGRHETGSYYTPRAIVSFMCREALKGYLSDRTEAKPDAVARLIDDHEIEGVTDTCARQVVEALDNLKAVDPACGSGAYLLGLLHELIAIYRLLFSEKLTRDARSLYDLKLRIISHNLYGVDIDPFATNIAMLRLWLSLAVEAAEPIALPNLDFKIETGDSLLGPCESIADTLQGHSLRMRAAALMGLKDKYLTTHGPAKVNAKAAIDSEETAIRRQLQHLGGEGIVDWHVQFAEVFGNNEGFDIVLANPPYVRQELIAGNKKELRAMFPGSYSGTADLYVYFYHRAIQLLRNRGILSFISPNKFFRAGYGEKLRGFLSRHSELLTLIDFADYPIFQAITYPAIVVTQKSVAIPREHKLQTYNWRSSDNLEQITSIIREHSQPERQASIGVEAWRILDKALRRVFDKLRAAGTCLGDCLDDRFYRGIVTGCNAAFEVDGETRSRLIDLDPSSNEIIKPWVRGKNVRRWHIEYDNKYVIYATWDTDINRYPAIKSHLLRFHDILAARPECKQGRFNWWCLSRYGSEYAREYERPKIVYKVISTHQELAFTTLNAITNDKTWFIPDPPPGLLGILNAKVIWFFLNHVVAKLQGGAFELRSPYMRQVPIVTPVRDLIRKAESLQALAEQGEGTSEKALALEMDIDEIVVRMYGLTQEDEAIIDENIKMLNNRFPRGKFRESSEYKSYVAEMFGEE